MDDLKPFATLVEALNPWLDELVFIGGWGHRLHTLHPSAAKLDFAPLLTRDTDMAFQDVPSLKGDLKTALLDKGFKEDPSGEATPPTTHYTWGDEQAGFYAEFLTPLTGSGRKRLRVTDTNASDVTVRAGNISAQKIRHLDILLVDPWQVIVGPPHNDVPLQRAVSLRVANPLCFMVQKFLIKSSRPRRKQAQDLLYVHDTIQLFSDRLEDFKIAWDATVKPELRESAETVMKECKELCAGVTDELRDAAKIPQDRKLKADEMLAVYKFAFQSILGI